MTGRTHDLAAITALGIVFVFIGAPAHATVGTVLLAILANQIGGILPDIDQPTAPFWRNLPVGTFFGRIFDTLTGGHRFLTHSLLGVGLFALLAWLLLQFIHPIIPHVDSLLVWWAFVIGIISHLLMDTLTKEGVPWFLPLPAKLGLPPIKALRITTGKSVELLVVVPALLILDIWLCTSHYGQLVGFIHHLVSA